MSKRTRTSEVEKEIKEGHDTGVYYKSSDNTTILSLE